MGMSKFRAMRIYRHSAHRVLDASLGLIVRAVLSGIVVRVRFVNCHDDPALSLYTLRG